jgi:hypothetical protein
MKKTIIMSMLNISFIHAFCEVNYNLVDDRVITTFIENQPVKWSLYDGNLPPVNINQIYKIARKYALENLKEYHPDAVDINLKSTNWNNRLIWYWSVKIERKRNKSPEAEHQTSTFLFLPVALDGKVMANITKNDTQKK